MRRALSAATGVALGVLLALPTGAAAGPAASRGKLSPLPPAGATAAQGLTIFTISGTPLPSRINAFAGPLGRLTLVSPEGITAPVTANGECTQDSATQVSCAAGFVDVVSGHLGGGADTFTAAPSLKVMIGASLAGATSPLNGGGGRDRLIGGGGSDALVGGRGPDLLAGLGSSDLLRGGAGRDRLRGGKLADALFGGAGHDTLDGGKGRDLCSGGGGRDRARACTTRKKIP